VAFSRSGNTYVAAYAWWRERRGGRCFWPSDRRRLVKVERASRNDFEPFLPAFWRLRRLRHPALGRGCAIALEARIVVETLAQHGIDARSQPLSTRTATAAGRITLHARMGTPRRCSGRLCRGSSHDIIPIDRCPILDPALDGALDAAWALAEALAPVRKPLDIQVTATKGGLDIDVRGSGPLSAATITKLSTIAQKHGWHD